VSFLDKLKDGLDSAKENVSDFVETSRVKREIDRLENRKQEVFAGIGRRMYALFAEGRSVPEIEAECRELASLDTQIAEKGEEIKRINTENPPTA
jgi:hypothetical protein